ncbi:HEPN domain-containing protein [Roseofilum casamattae]|uniref:Apea-like HEPN domain-containing protein n=1 Tax=Roseofilum casamattae BLCC-M143 TaxID=3022442 RepID=A0ABT7BZI9_9CYAN|nr:HEPN domain-containing protein [Roseofilum casamattae]MDJ1184617.1 hypothetical protein [Roseofilum casamattae BLCC-M143]
MLPCGRNDKHLTGLDIIYIEDRFLNLVRALEVYCRCHISGELMPLKEFASIKRKIAQLAMEILDESTSKWFSQNGDSEKDVKKSFKVWLNYKLSNYKTLQDKLLEILEGLSDLKIEDSLARPNDEIANKITKMRNHFTHYSNRKTLKEFDMVELIDITCLIEYIVQGILLRDIGIPLTYLKDNPYYIGRMKDIRDRFSIS